MFLFLTFAFSAANLLAAMDKTASPCIDFFQYACGTWNRMHLMPEDKSSINTFEVLADQLQIILKRLLREPPNVHDNNATKKAKMFYKSCMDICGYTEVKLDILLWFRFLYTYPLSYLTANLIFFFQFHFFTSPFVFNSLFNLTLNLLHICLKSQSFFESVENVDV